MSGGENTEDDDDVCLKDREGMTKSDNKEQIHRLDAMSISSIPLFMNELPTDAPENVSLGAIQALLYEGPPKEQALNFKNQGNECYLLGPPGWKDALRFYTRGLDAKCCDDKLNATLYLNRAAVNLALKNWGDTIRDAKEALKLDPEGSTKKAHVRILKAAISLGKVAEARDAYNIIIKEPGMGLDDELLKEYNNFDEETRKEEGKKAEREKELDKIRKIVAGTGVTVVRGIETDLISQFGPELDYKQIPSVLVILKVENVSGRSS